MGFEEVNQTTFLVTWTVHNKSIKTQQRRTRLSKLLIEFPVHQETMVWT